MNNTNLLQSKEAVLQAAIDILRQAGGSANATTVYEQFSKLIGHPVNETEASNIYQILTESKANSCLVQPDGQCLYINSSNDQVFSLEVNPEKTGTHTPNATSMNEALNEADKTTGYTPVPSSQSSAVVEPNQLVKSDSAAGQLAAQNEGSANDEQADADALIDVAEDEAHKTLKDREIDLLADRIRHDEKEARIKEERIKEHEAQMSKDKSKLLKDFREAEIRHDERVINDEAKREDKLDEDIIAKSK